MKIILIILSLSCHIAMAQNVLVRFYSDTTNHPNVSLGIPLHWINTFQKTNNSIVPKGWSTNFTDAQFSVYWNSNIVFYRSWQSNIQWQADNTIEVNVNKLRDLYKDMIAYEEFCRVSNPSPAQVAVQIRKINGALLLLRPVIQELYKGQE